MGATFAGDTFYVLFAPTGDRGIRVARVSTDGALLGIDSLLDDVPVRDPFFVDGASEPRIVYSTWVMTPVEFDPQGGGVGWIFVEQSLDPAGGPPGAPHTLTTDGGDFQWIKGVAFGTDTVVALEGAHQPPRLAAARLAADGTLATAPFDITDGTQPEWHRIVRRGTEAVVAWFGTPASLHVARLRP
jgi:hypothetical protein